MKGDMVTIYKKPLTHDLAEGEAKLIKLLISDDGILNLNFWDVEFASEPGTIYQRWVYPG